MVLICPADRTGAFQDSRTFGWKKRKTRDVRAERAELRSARNVTAIEVTHMCTFFPALFGFAVCTRAGATCVRHLMTTYLKSRSRFLLFYLQKEEKTKQLTEGGKMLCVSL